MLRLLVLGIYALLTNTEAAIAQLQRENCQTQGPQFHVDQNSKITIDTIMDTNGCRYAYNIAGNPAQANARFIATIIEKVVIMNHPRNGTLSQSGEFSFFYKPNQGFRGKDSFTVYICGSTQHNSGCARLTYNAMVR